MCFKKMLAVWTALALALSGCGIQVGEKPPEETPVSYSGKGYTCVGQIPQHIERYMKDQLNDTEITDFVRCLQKAFTSFAQYTRGKETSNYQADEIRNFLQKSFIRDRVISDELLHEFMVIKQALVGGDQQRITRVELFDAIKFLENLRVEAIRLRPHLRVLNPRLIQAAKDAAQTEADRNQLAVEMSEGLTQAKAAVNQSIQALANHLEKSKRNYPLANLEAFLTEFREFVRWDEHFPQSHSPEKWIKLLRAFKEATVSPVDPDVIHEDEWGDLLTAMSNWYMTYLQYRVGIQDRPILNGTGLQNSIYVVNQAIGYTRSAVQAQGGDRPTLKFDQINRMVVAMHDIGWIPEKIRPESLDQALRNFTVRMLGDQNIKPSSRHTAGLDLQSLAVLDQEFQRWSYVQMTIEKHYPRQIAQSASVPNVKSGRNATDIFANVGGAKDSKAGSYWSEFIKVKTQMEPIFAEEFPRVMLIPKAEQATFGVKHEFYNLSMMNLLRSIAGLIFRGYAETPVPGGQWTSGITSSELQEFYLGFRDIGIDLAWIDKRNTEAGKRAYVEGKLFTSSSKGLKFDPQAPNSGGTLGFAEAMEYFAYLYSGGQGSMDIYKELAKELCKPDDNSPRDINDLPKLSRRCVQTHLPTMVGTYMGNMPYLQQYMTKLGEQDPQTKAAYAKVMLDTARQPEQSVEDWVEKNELSTMAVVVHYTESLMNRFDTNGDGKLENKELFGDKDSGAALALFSGFLKKVNHDELAKKQDEAIKAGKTPEPIKELTDAEARAALFYILYYRSMPSGVFDKMYVGVFKNWEPTLSMDRFELAQVFKAFISKLFEKSRKGDTPSPPISASLPGITKFSAAPSPTR